MRSNRGLKFLENRDNPDAFEPAPDADAAAEQPAPATSAPAAGDGPATYTVRVNGKSYTVEVSAGGEDGRVVAAEPEAARATPAPGGGETVQAVLAGNIFKVHVSVGDTVNEGDPLLVVEAMKMETVVAAPASGTVSDVFVKEGDAIAVGDDLATIG